MLQIHAQQVASFEDNARTKFEARMLVHLKRFFACQCAALDEATLRRTIRLGIERATHHGILAERDVCLFIDVMLMLGESFDCDPSLPWVRAILRDGHARGPSGTVDLLYETASLARSLGPA
jgi:hypothetical protein